MTRLDKLCSTEQVSHLVLSLTDPDLTLCEELGAIIIISREITSFSDITAATCGEYYQWRQTSGSDYYCRYVKVEGQAARPINYLLNLNYIVNCSPTSLITTQFTLDLLHCFLEEMIQIAGRSDKVYR